MDNAMDILIGCKQLGFQPASKMRINQLNLLDKEIYNRVYKKIFNQDIIIFDKFTQIIYKEINITYN